jgi:hypothetical protein
LNPKPGIGQGLGHIALDLNGFFLFRHISPTRGAPGPNDFTAESYHPTIFPVGV